MSAGNSKLFSHLKILDLAAFKLFINKNILTKGEVGAKDIWISGAVFYSDEKHEEFLNET